MSSLHSRSGSEKGTTSEVKSSLVAPHISGGFICIVCQCPIYSSQGKRLKFGNINFHDSCFKCSFPGCGMNLSELHQCSLINDLFYCKDHVSEVCKDVFSPSCKPGSEFRNGYSTMPTRKKSAMKETSETKVVTKPSIPPPLPPSREKSFIETSSSTLQKYATWQNQTPSGGSLKGCLKKPQIPSPLPPLLKEKNSVPVPPPIPPKRLQNYSSQTLPNRKKTLQSSASCQKKIASEETLTPNENSITKCNELSILKPSSNVEQNQHYPSQTANRSEINKLPAPAPYLGNVSSQSSITTKSSTLNNRKSILRPLSSGDENISVPVPPPIPSKQFQNYLSQTLPNRKKTLPAPAPYLGNISSQPSFTTKSSTLNNRKSILRPPSSGDQNKNFSSQMFTSRNSLQMAPHQDRILPQTRTPIESSTVNLNHNDKSIQKHRSTPQKKESSVMNGSIHNKNKINNSQTTYRNGYSTPTINHHANLTLNYNQSSTSYQNETNKSPISLDANSKLSQRRKHTLKVRERAKSVGDDIEVDDVTDPNPYFGKLFNAARSVPSLKKGDYRTSQLTTTIPKCNFCLKTIRGPFFVAGSKMFCPKHFVCANQSCQVPLKDIGFIDEPTGMYCEHCFGAYFAPECSRCQNKILGECVNAIGRKFHPDCFKCSYCHKKFGNSSFYIVDGKTYCIQDWIQIFANKCYGCRKPIITETNTEAMGHYYHHECFKCTMCNKVLTNKFKSISNRPFCTDHERISNYHEQFKYN